MKYKNITINFTNSTIRNSMNYNRQSNNNEAYVLNIKGYVLLSYDFDNNKMKIAKSANQLIKRIHMDEVYDTNFTIHLNYTQICNTVLSKI